MQSCSRAIGILYDAKQEAGKAITVLKGNPFLGGGKVNQEILAIIKKKRQEGEKLKLLSNMQN